MTWHQRSVGRRLGLRLLTRLLPFPVTSRPLAKFITASGKTLAVAVRRTDIKLLTAETGTLATRVSSSDVMQLRTVLIFRASPQPVLIRDSTPGRRLSIKTSWSASLILSHRVWDLKPNWFL